MTRRVSKENLSRELRYAEKEQSVTLLKKASEQHIGTCKRRDGVTGAPVIELGYTLGSARLYLKRLIWRHINEAGVVPRAYQSRPQDGSLVLEAGFF